MERNGLNGKEMAQHKSHHYAPIATGVEQLSICKKRFGRSALARAISKPSETNGTDTAQLP